MFKIIFDNKFNFFTVSFFFMYVIVSFSGETTHMSKFYVDSPKIEFSAKTSRLNHGEDIVDD